VHVAPLGVEYLRAGSLGFPITRVLPRTQNWLDGISEFLVARPDVHFAAV